MDLLQNPFYILTATQQDDRRRIMELTEERGLLSDADKCIAAQTKLVNPRTRISAEVAWLPGCVSERVYDLLMLLESSAGNHLGNDETTSIAPVDSLASALSRLPYAKKYNVADKVLELLKPSMRSFIQENSLNSFKTNNLMELGKFLGIDKLTPIARANLLAARMSRLPDYTPDGIAKWILAIAQAFEAINPIEVHATLNEERKVSGFPEITDLSTIELEIRNRRLYYQQVIKSTLKNILTAKARVRSVTTVLSIVKTATDSGKNSWPILIEATVDSYEIEAQTSLGTVEKNIETQDKKIRIAAEMEEPDTIFASMVDEFIETVRDWGIIAAPIQLNKNRQGLRHNASHDIADRVRQLAIHLFNEYDKLDFSQKILNVLQEVFTGIPAIAGHITADLETLNKIAKRREQQIF